MFPYQSIDWVRMAGGSKTQNSANLKLKGGRHSRFSSRSTPWAPGPMPQLSPLPSWASKRYKVTENLGEMLDEEIPEFVAHMSLTKEEDAARANFSEAVEKVTSDLWPKSELKVFGSWSTDSCLPTSDIDFTLCGVESSEATKLSEALEEAGFSTNLITNTKVPLVRLVDDASGVNADISFNMAHAAASAMNMRKLLEKYPLARPLIMILKSVLRLNNLNELYTGGLSSYSLSLMVVFYLKHCSGAQAIDTDSKSTSDDDENSSEEPKDSGSSDTSDQQLSFKGVGNYLLGFLDYYGLDPQIPSTIDFTSSSLSLHSGFIDRIGGSTLSLSIEDPLCLDNDVARGSFRMNEVRLAFTSTLRGLKWYHHCATMFNDSKAYALAPPPSTPLIAIFGCSPRDLYLTDQISWNAFAQTMLPPQDVNVLSVVHSGNYNTFYNQNVSPVAAASGRGYHQNNRNANRKNTSATQLSSNIHNTNWRTDQPLSDTS